MWASSRKPPRRRHAPRLSHRVRTRRGNHDQPAAATPTPTPQPGVLLGGVGGEKDVLRDSSPSRTRHVLARPHASSAAASGLLATTGTTTTVLLGPAVRRLTSSHGWQGPHRGAARGLRRANTQHVGNVVVSHDPPRLYASTQPLTRSSSDGPHADFFAARLRKQRAAGKVAGRTATAATAPVSGGNATFAARSGSAGALIARRSHATRPHGTAGPVEPGAHSSLRAARASQPRGHSHNHGDSGRRVERHFRYGGADVLVVHDDGEPGAEEGGSPPLYREALGSWAHHDAAAAGSPSPPLPSMLDIQLAYGDDGQSDASSGDDNASPIIVSTSVPAATAASDAMRRKHNAALHMLAARSSSPTSSPRGPSARPSLQRPSSGEPSAVVHAHRPPATPQQPPTPSLAAPDAATVPVQHREPVSSPSPTPQRSASPTMTLAKSGSRFELLRIDTSRRRLQSPQAQEQQPGGAAATVSTVAAPDAAMEQHRHQQRQHSGTTSAHGVKAHHTTPATATTTPPAPSSVPPSPPAPAALVGHRGYSHGQHPNVSRDVVLLGGRKGKARKPRHAASSTTKTLGASSRGGATQRHGGNRRDRPAPTAGTPAPPHRPVCSPALRMAGMLQDPHSFQSVLRPRRTPAGTSRAPIGGTRDAPAPLPAGPHPHHGAAHSLAETQPMPLPARTPGSAAGPHWWHRGSVVTFTDEEGDEEEHGSVAGLRYGPPAPPPTPAFVGSPISLSHVPRSSTVTPHARPQTQTHSQASRRFAVGASLGVTEERATVASPLSTSVWSLDDGQEAPPTPLVRLQRRRHHQRGSLRPRTSGPGVGFSGDALFVKTPTGVPGRRQGSPTTTRTEHDVSPVEEALQVDEAQRTTAVPFSKHAQLERQRAEFKAALKRVKVSQQNSRAAWSVFETLLRPSRLVLRLDLSKTRNTSDDGRSAHACSLRLLHAVVATLLLLRAVVGVSLSTRAACLLLFMLPLPLPVLRLPCLACVRVTQQTVTFACVGCARVAAIRTNPSTTDCRRIEKTSRRWTPTLLSQTKASSTGQAP